MTKVKTLMCSLGLVGLLFGISACSGGGPIGEMEKLVNEMCDCKDKACLEGVQKKMEKLPEKYGDKKPEDFSADEQKKMMELTAKMMSCAEKAEKIMTGDKKGEKGEEDKK